MSRNFEGRRNLRILWLVHEVPILPPRDGRHIVLKGVKYKENISSKEADTVQIDAAFLFMFQQWTICLYPQGRVISHHVKSFYLTIWPDNRDIIISTKRTGE